MITDIIRLGTVSKTDAKNVRTYAVAKEPAALTLMESAGITIMRSERSM